ncbi:Type-1 restriction enzyme EcoKI specificity protein [bacterium HR15]|nr:Type-1 restriction enzyme EcoKI specificity protein [bacterium HR15]
MIGQELGKMVQDDSAMRTDGYKMTELGPLPEEWQVVRLGEVVALIRNGLTYRQYRIPPGIPVSRIETISEGRINPAKVGYLRDISLQSIESYRLIKGDILFSHINSEPHLGKTAIYTGEPQYLVHGMNLLLIRPRPESLDYQFLNYLFNVYREKGVFIGLAARAVGQASINQGKLRQLPIPLPPLPEQRAIAHVLRTVQQAKEAGERVAAALKQLKKSLMQHLFTYGPVPVGAQCFAPLLQETEIGALPAHWQVVRLGEIFEIQQGKSLSPRSRTGPRMRPFLRTANVLWGRIDVTKVDKMHFDEPEERRLSLRHGDILVCEGGEIGRTAMWEDQLPLCLYQNHLHRLRSLREDVFPLFYMYWMQAAWTLLALYGGLGNKTTIPNLSQSRLAAFPIPLPPLPEQREIARILRTVDQRIEAEEASVRALETLFKTLLHELMTAKRRLPRELIARFSEPQTLTRE